MDNENEQAHEVVEEQEESTHEEDTDLEDDSEETVTISKAKFKKLQYRAKAYVEEKTKPQPKITNSSADTKWRERMELKVEGYDDASVDFILKNGGRKALENPFVVKAIEGMKEQRLAEQATIDSGAKSETEKRFNPKDFAKLSADEQIKVLSEI